MNEEVGLPKATILNLIKEFLPAETRITNEANEVILKLSNEFVNHLSSISNDICLEGGKKTISQAHVAEAMKKLKLNTYLAKIMNVEDFKDLEGMTDKKRKEMLNSSLNVTRKKKKGISKEEEEELRKKQALLFQEDQQLEMMPSELQRSMSTPVIQTAHAPQPGGPVYQPSDMKFYDGSITQVLHNPEINTAMQHPNLAPITLNPAYPNSLPPTDIQQNLLTKPEATKDEDDEEMITTTKVQPDSSTPASNGHSDPALQVQHHVSVNDIQSATAGVDQPTNVPQPIQMVVGQYNVAQTKPKQHIIEDEEEDFE
jgi:histone H3/H4